MAGPVLPSQTSHELATQEPAALSMLSLDLGKTAWLGSPCIQTLNRAEGRADLTDRVSRHTVLHSHLRLHAKFMDIQLHFSSSDKVPNTGNSGKKQLLLALNSTAAGKPRQREFERADHNHSQSQERGRGALGRK